MKKLKLDGFDADTQAKMKKINDLIPQLNQIQFLKSGDKKSVTPEEMIQIRDILKTVSKFRKNNNDQAALNYLNKVKNELSRPNR